MEPHGKNVIAGKAAAAADSKTFPGVNVTTGVTVCSAMPQGGPHPATTDARFTSVGTSAIKQFARPAGHQNFPDAGLPAELPNDNSRYLRRLADGNLMKTDC